MLIGQSSSQSRKVGEVIWKEGRGAEEQGREGREHRSMITLPLAVLSTLASWGGVDSL